MSSTEGDPHRWLNTLSFSWGIMQVFTNYVALIGNTVGEYRQAVTEEKQKKHSSDNIWKFIDKGQVRYASTDEAKTAVVRAALEALTIFLGLIMASAVTISLSTRNLDERMIQIIEGISRVTSSTVVGMLSVRVGHWVRLYYTPVWIMSFRSDNKRLSTHTLVELKHRVRWSVSRKMLRTFFVLWLFFQGAPGVTIPGSIVAGISFGLAVDYCTYLCRRIESQRLKLCASLTMVCLLMLMSIAQFSTGVFFIATVWEDDVYKARDSTWDLCAFLFYSFALPSVHVVVWWLGKRTRAKALVSDSDCQHDICRIDSISSSSRPRMATSMYFSSKDINAADDDHSEETGNHKVDYEVILREEDEQISAVKDVDFSQPTLTQLMNEWTWCGCARGDDKSTSEKIYGTLYWIVYLFVCGLFIVVTFINIYATRQQEYARQKMPFVNEAIYNNMDEGPVCAFDNRGADSNITTFPDKQAAHAVDFQVLHCGACGACSDWHNLRLEYITRDRLAAESRKCATKSLFGGSNQVLIDCLESDSIGFQSRCAECWAEDIMCTKKFCWAIGVQSFFINTLTNFVVNADTITAAACEEANCEAGNPGHFVSCSGATRRRMNVTSSIARPGAQQCSIVDVDYQSLFPECFQSRFVKSAQSLRRFCTVGTEEASYTTADGLAGTRTDPKTLYRHLMKLVDKDFTKFHVYRKFFGFKVATMDTSTYRIFTYGKLVKSDEFHREGALECRGHTFEADKDCNYIQMMCRPCEKFFNLNENDFTTVLNLSSIVAIEDKMDGSLLSTFIHRHGNEALLRLKSRNALVSEHVDASTEWLGLPENREFRNDMEQLSLDGYTINLEWVNPEKPILLKYPKADLRVLNIRNIESGAYLEYESIDKDQYPAIVKAWTERLPLEDDLEAQTQRLLAERETEGVVVRFESRQRVKLKIQWYFNCHLLKNTTSERNLIDAVLTGKTDDTKGLVVLFPNQLAKIRWMEDRVKANLQHAEGLVDDFYETNKALERRYYTQESQKEFRNMKLMHCAMSKYQ